MRNSIHKSVCLSLCSFVTLFQIQAIILSLPAYSHLIHFSRIVWPICQDPLVNLPFLWIFWSFNQGSSVTLLFVYLNLKAFLSKKSLNAQRSASYWPCYYWLVATLCCAVCTLCWRCSHSGQRTKVAASRSSTEPSASLQTPTCYRCRIFL